MSIRPPGRCLSKLLLLLVVLVALGAVVWYFHRDRARQVVDVVAEHLSEEQREQIGQLTEDASGHLRRWSNQVTQAIEERAVRRLGPRASLGLAMDEFNQRDFTIEALAREGALDERHTELQALEAVYALTDQIHQTDRALLVAYRTLLDFLQRRQDTWSVNAETGEVEFANSRDALRYKAFVEQIEQLRQRQEEQLRELEALMDPSQAQEDRQQARSARDEAAPSR